jgi:hypothetical protein
MGICTEVRATGAWCDALRQSRAFSFQAELDAQVCLRLFAAGFTSASVELAELFGVPFSSGVHPVDATLVDPHHLHRWCSRFAQSGAAGTADQFLHLRDAGFAFEFFLE